MYKIPATEHRVEEIVQKSRFITTIVPIENEAAVKPFVASIKQEFADASHNCWAYVAGEPGNTATIGMSDDGEPHGTAGRPMLTVLLHSEVGEVAAVVTRYFGGIKLGTGGLVKAYSGAVKNALLTLPTKEKKDTVLLNIQFDYSSINLIKQAIASLEGEIKSEHYGAGVALEVNMTKNHREEFTRLVLDLTKGSAFITVV